ncbi:MAG TPA: hypothetical protein ENJ50_02660, partial [Planctomycetaceae bacterium]|nr:hypothetical protein [Planctomycetaceae bacterium]
MLSAILTCALISAPPPIQATVQRSTEAVVRHRLAVQLEPEQHTLRVRDAISLPEDGRAGEVIFTLSDVLAI